MREILAVVVLVFGSFTPSLAESQFWPKGRNGPVPPSRNGDRYQPTLDIVLQPGTWVITPVGGLSGTSTATFASHGLTQTPPVSALNTMVAVSWEKMRSDRVALGIGVEIGGFYVSRPTPGAEPQLGVGFRGGVFRLGPMLTLLQPVSEQWFLQTQVNAGLGPSVDWTPDGRTVTALGGVAAAGVGLGRLIGQYSAVDAQIRRVEGRMLGGNPAVDVHHGRWEIRLGMRLFTTTLIELGTPEPGFRR